MFAFGSDSSTNYPAGSNPWNGQPVQTRPNYTFLTPGVVVSAAEMNWIFGSLSAAAAQAITVPGLNWLASQNLSGVGYLPTGASWDPNSNMWLVCASASGGAGTCDVLQSVGDGTTVSSFVSNGSGRASAGVAHAALFDGTHYYMIAVASGHLSVYDCTPGGAWGSAIFTDSTFTITGNVKAHHFNGAYYAIGGDATGHLVFFGSNAPASAWGDVGGISQACTGGVVTAQSPSVIVAFPITANPTSYAYGTDPINVSLVAQSASFLAVSGEEPRGVCWSPADSCFVLITTAGDATARVYQSTDGITWTKVGSFASSVAINGLAATDAGCLVAEWVQASANQLIYSVDGGVSWHLAAPTLATGASLTPGKVAASPTGFLALTNAAFRFSLLSGLTPALT